MSNELAAHYLEEVRRQFRGHKRLAEGAIAQLTDDELFFVPDAEANSVAVLMKHMAGNMRSRFTNFLTTDGEKPDRHRDQEFEMPDRPSRAELMKTWEAGWDIVFSTLASLKPEDVGRTVTIRGEPHTVLQAFNRAIAHYAQHTGQIVFLAKHIRSRDWQSLSIPRGKSEEVNRKFLTEQQARHSGSKAG
ncbi:MAG TPA: DUF1572 family protein [Terriglobales bacterium]|nr:DUF1572 family protein [Terriglobales bacterium]